ASGDGFKRGQTLGIHPVSVWPGLLGTCLRKELLQRPGLSARQRGERTLKLRLELTITYRPQYLRPQVFIDPGQSDADYLRAFFLESFLSRQEDLVHFRVSAFKVGHHTDCLATQRIRAKRLHEFDALRINVLGGSIVGVLAFKRIENNGL